MTRRTGLEISATAVRLAELDLRGRPRLVAYVHEPLPRGAVVEGAVVEVDLVREAIARCLADRHFRRRRLGGAVAAYLGISGLRAITREIELPRVPDEELDSAIRLQALDIVPFPVENAVLSARRLGPVEGAAFPTDRVLLAAAHRELVDPILEAVVAAGVVPLGVDFAPFSLMRAFADTAEHGPEGIVAIGADLTTVVIHQRGEPQLVRTIAGGGATVTRAIAAAMDIPFADAEAMKLRLGAPVAGAALPIEATAAARDASMTLLGEIRSSIQYFSSMHGEDCTKVVLTGGGALLSGLQERLQQLMPIPVAQRTCLARLERRRIRPEDAEALDAVGGVVIGTALPPPAGTKAIDLLPPDVVAARRRHRAERIAVTAAGVGVLGLAGAGALRYEQAHRVDQSVATLQQSIQLLNRQIRKYDHVAAEHQALLVDEGIAQPLVSHEVNWPAVLQAIDRYTPKGVAASGFSGTSTAPPTATATSTRSGAGAAPPAPSATLGSVSLTLTGPSYPAFQDWFNSISASQRLTIVQFSGVTSAGSQVTFSAQLAITGRISTSRLSRFAIGGGNGAS